MRLNVRQPPLKIDTDIETIVSKEVWGCCCFFSQGSARIEANFEKSAYTPSDIIRAMIKVDNTYVSRPIESITFLVHQRSLFTDSWFAPEYEEEEKGFQKQARDFEGPVENTGGGRA